MHQVLRSERLVMTYFILFFFGLAVGSFLYVVSLRYLPGQNPEGKPLASYGAGLLDLKIIGGRSRCPHCRETLKWYELIPLLSFIIQKGRCRNCGKRLSLQYPLVEFLSGLIFVFVPFVSVNSLQFIIYSQFLQFLVIGSWLLIFILFLLLSIIDFHHYIIPDLINLVLGSLGIILIALNQKIGNFGFITGSFMGHYAAIFGFRESIWLNHFFAAFLGMAFFGLVIILTRGRAMGWGDFKLVGALGLIFGWPDIIMIIALSFIIGSIFVAPLLIKGRKNMKDAVPFGPFMIMASVLVFFIGFQMIDSYFKLFGIIR